MKIFISCSTSDAIKDGFKEEACIIGKELSKLDYEMVFGSSTKGLLGIVYKEFLRNKKDITAIVPKELVGDLTEVECTNKILIDDVMDHPARLINYSDIILVMPGGMGTLAELSLALHTRRFLHNKPIIIMNIDGYFDNLISFFKTQVKEKCLFEKDSNMYIETKNANETIDILKKL